MGTLRVISDSDEPFADRAEAGQLLAEQLQEFRGERPVLLGIPRGGVVIARRTALALGADLDIVLTHKIGAPFNKELAIGAVCEDGKLFVEQTIARHVGASRDYIARAGTEQLREIAHKVELYRTVLPKLPLGSRLVIVTDDGVATGSTMLAALWAVRNEKPAEIVLALPVGPPDTLTKLAEHADRTVCLKAPPFFEALSRFYLQFGQVEDEELLEMLKHESERRTRQ